MIALAPLFYLGFFVKILVSPFVVQGVSMMPTLHDAEIFLVDKVSYHFVAPKRDDIAVFSLRSAPKYFYVKRIIGLPGETIHLKKDGVYLVDGQTLVEKKLNESFILPEKYLPDKFLGTNELGEKFTVPVGKYFVLGDNRLNSEDSRYFDDPFVPKENIVGKFSFPLFDFSQHENVAEKSMSSSGNEISSNQTVSGVPSTGQILPTVLLKIQQGDKVFDFNVELAKSEQERETGLMFRTSLSSKEGMFFIYDRPQVLNFWMKNTLIPLDMIFVDKDFKVVHIAKSSMPCKADPCTIYSSGIDAQYVLEIQGGLSEKLGIVDGATVEIGKMSNVK